MRKGWKYLMRIAPIFFNQKTESMENGKRKSSKKSIRFLIVKDDKWMG